MPFKRKESPSGLVAPIPPAIRFYLLLGQWPPQRCRGWVDLAQAGMFGQPTLEERWATHGELLTAEARQAGFEPAGIHGRLPTGEAVLRWADAFVDQYHY
jgi:hypothetical protein